MYAIYTSELTNFFVKRWDRAKGKNVSSDKDFWYKDEPNVKEFDYDTRNLCPMTRKAYEACSSDPGYDCSVSNEFKCDYTPDDRSAINPSFRLNYILFRNSLFFYQNFCLSINKLYILIKH